MLAVFRMNTSLIDDIKYSTIDIAEEVESMTTVIGIACKNGIILATDSQGSYGKGIEMKRFGVNKIIPITRNGINGISLAMAGSGDAKHIKRLGEELTREIGDKQLGDIELKDRVEDLLYRIYRKYNVERSNTLGIENRQYFHPTSILAARLFPTGYGLYLLSNDPWIEPIMEYETIGSGAPFADLLLKQIQRSFSIANRNFRDMDIEIMLAYSCYVINEVKTVDIQSGGQTRIGIITNKGYADLTEEQISKIYQHYVGVVSHAFTKAIDDPNITAEMLKDVYPPEK